MKKVIILGSPGSGKSTFAMRLHDQTKLPLVHLDFYYHQSKYDYINNREPWIARVKELMKPNRWIIDGNYQSTIPLRCEEADTIILFDLPRWLCLYRVLKRRIHFRNKKREDMPSEWVEKANGTFMKFVWEFNKNQLPPILEQLKKNKNKRVVIFKGSSDAERFLAEIKNPSK